ncbi:MAG TPA: hypothetical protein VGC79_26135 [Polyangiaceae bacterium]
MTRALLAPALVLAALLGAGSARAAPSIWQRASHPQASAQQAVLNRIERLLGSLGLPELGAELSAGAIALSQLGQANWPCLTRGGAPANVRSAALEIVLDPRLEYLIGGALLDSQGGREPEARCLLERALRDAPNSPLAARGLSDLAIAAAKMGDREAEHAAYLRALELTWQPDSRGNLLANLAESDMALGNLGRAVRGYRNALTVS